MNNIKLNKYLSKIRLKRNIYFSNKNISLRKYDFAVVIPVYGEYEYIAKTIISLVKNDTDILSNTLILLVINNPEVNPDPGYVAENKQLLIDLNNSSLVANSNLEKLNLAWIDASSEGQALPDKGGVGVARKLGMDSSLNFLNWENSPVIVSLDADTIVESNYLFEINNYFAGNKKTIAATIDFQHLPANSKEEEKAIRDYELFIHDYVDKMKYVGSPYAFFTIGSAMTCRGKAYVRVGGMKQNRAGEDFYFLQDLRKIGEVGNITETRVYQSARPSDRVPFGTGPKIQQCVAGIDVLFYNHKIFEVLKEVIHNIEIWIRTGIIDNPEQLIDNLPEDAKEYFALLNFNSVWPKILVNNIKKNKEITALDFDKLIWAFHVWFDAFKTLKFVHFLERKYPDKYHKEKIAKWNQ